MDPLNWEHSFLATGALRKSLKSIFTDLILIANLRGVCDNALFYIRGNSGSELSFLDVLITASKIQDFSNLKTKSSFFLEMTRDA